MTNVESRNHMAVTKFVFAVAIIAVGASIGVTPATADDCQVYGRHTCGNAIVSSKEALFIADASSIHPPRALRYFVLADYICTPSGFGRMATCRTRGNER